MAIEKDIETMEAWCVTDIAVPAQESWERIKDAARNWELVERMAADPNHEYGLEFTHPKHRYGWEVLKQEIGKAPQQCQHWIFEGDSAEECLRKAGLSNSG